MLHRVCRAYGQSPDEVRAWNWSDYLDAQESFCEMPWVEDLLKGFLGGSKGKSQSNLISLTDPKAREDWLKVAESKGGDVP